MFILPLRTDSPLRTTPYVNYFLIAANVAVFIATYVNPALANRWAVHPRSPHVTEFITYQFIHAGPLHLLGNMLFLYIFGNNVNDKMGQLGYAAFYLAGGVMAGVAYTVGERVPGASMVGASGSIAAVTGAYLILFPRSHISLVYWFIFIGRLELQAVLVIGFFFAMDFLNLGSQDSVAHVAHVGGTVFGALICLGLLATQLLPRDQFDVWALASRWNKRRQYRDMVAKGYNPFDITGGGAEPATPRRPAPVADPRVAALRDRITAALSDHRTADAADLYVELKVVDPAQVLSRQAQLDVATQLHHDDRHRQAAEAYESLLRTYPKFDRLDQVELMLGLLYSRYLHQYDKARTHLTAVAGRVHGGRELDLARDELSAIEAALPQGPA